MRLLLLGWLLAWLPLAMAVPLTGTGYGKTQAEARKAALASLAEAVQVEVISEFQMHTDTESGRQAKQVIETRAELPILGAEIRPQREFTGFEATAVLEPAKACPRYRQRLSQLAEAIGQGLNRARQAAKARDDQAEYAALSRLLAKFEEYVRHRSVAQALAECGELEAPQVSQHEIEARMHKLGQRAMSLAQAAERLTRGISERAIYVYPAVPLGGQEITPFARALRDHLHSELATVSQASQAKYLMRGEYERLDDGVHVSYRLIDHKGNVRHATVTRIAAPAYADYRAEPQGLNLDRLLREGVVLSDELRVNVTTNRGAKDLLFEAGEEIKLLVKLNRPGWFYMLGHAGQAYTYLLELQDAQGPRRFLRYVSPEQANHWLDLGRFRVTPPFGTERVEVIASDADLADTLPQRTQDKHTGLYKVADKPTRAVRQTRALINAKLNPPPAAAKTQAPPAVAEAVLTFTTAPAEPD